MVILDNLVFRSVHSKITLDWEGSKPSSFPPNDGFVMSIGSDGNNLSHYGDDSWDFRTFGGNIMHFGKFRDSNKDLFKQIMFVHIYHFVLFPGTYWSIISYYGLFQKIIKVCEYKHNNIQLDELFRYPLVIEEIAMEVPDSMFAASINQFKKLLSIQEELGFKVLDEQAIKLYASLNPSYEHGQTAVIPPRIWNHYIQKCDVILDEFLECETQIKKAFNWIACAYEHNKKLGLNPVFSSPFNHRNSSLKRRKIYNGSFEKFIDGYNLRTTFEKYISTKKDSRDSSKQRFEISHFSALLSFGRDIASVYIQAYTLMRREESSWVRCNGLHIDEDKKYGKLYIVESKTTKTEDYSEALFPTSSSVEKAFKVAKFITKLRMRFAPCDTPKDILESPFILTAVLEPWKPSKDKFANRPIRPALPKQAKFGDDACFKITKEDYQFAVALTPTLLLERKKNEWFKVGNYWKFSDHQFRRTLAVQMNEFGVSKSTIQYCMKHRTQQMQNHYTKNSTRILTNKLANKAFFEERIQQVYLKLADVVINETGRYIKPYGKVQSIPVEVVNLIEELNFKKLYKEIKAGKTGIRLNLLGVCAKNGICEYGGVESISPCMGQHDESGKPCGDLVIDKMNMGDIQKYIGHCQDQQELFDEDSPAYQALAKEITAGIDAVQRMEA
jgi:hypothetical protein